MTTPNDPEPLPVVTESFEVWPIALNRRSDCPEWLRKDALERNERGKVKYGIGLQVFNERNALKDAYQEALDLWVYMEQCVLRMEQKAGLPRSKKENVPGTRTFADSTHRMFANKAEEAYRFAAWLGVLYHAGENP